VLGCSDGNVRDELRRHGAVTPQPEVVETLVPAPPAAANPAHEPPVVLVGMNPAVTVNASLFVEMTDAPTVPERAPVIAESARQGALEQVTPLTWLTVPPGQLATGRFA
jgi:hypothetical protein